MLKPGFEKQIMLEEDRGAAEAIQESAKPIRARIRFDYRGKARPSRFFFGGKSTEEAAEELRQQQAALWRNVPLQGIVVQDIQLGEIYTVYDEETDDEVAFAPLELDVTAESPADLVRFAVRDEFRRMQILEPERLVLTCREAERLLFQVHEQVRVQFLLKAKRYQD